MAQAIEYLWLIMDGIGAAFMGINVVPVLIIAVLVAVFNASKRFMWFKAFVCLGAALLADALWPLTFGGGVVVPSVTEPEVQVQIVMLYVLALAVLWGMRGLKNTISLTPIKSSKSLSAAPKNDKSVSH